MNNGQEDVPSMIMVEEVVGTKMVRIEECRAECLVN